MLGPNLAVHETNARSPPILRSSTAQEALFCAATHRLSLQFLHSSGARPRDVERVHEMLQAAHAHAGTHGSGGGGGSEERMPARLPLLRRRCCDRLLDAFTDAAAASSPLIDGKSAHREYVAILGFLCAQPE
eukprot:1090940-Pleurochrysis_carterae.AAC.1